MSQVQLAGDDMSSAYLSRLESGERPPTARVLDRLCARLDVPLSVFLAGEGSQLAQALAQASTIGETPEAAAQVEGALAREENSDAAVRWQALWWLAKCYQRHGHTSEELRVLHQMTALSDDIALPDLRTRSRVRLARRQRASGSLSLAHLTAGEALEIAETYDVPRPDVVDVLLTVISIDAEMGRLASARTRADDLVATLSDDLHPGLRTEVLWTAATVRIRQGGHRAAAQLMERALEVLPSNEDPVLWMRVRLAAVSMFLQMNPRDIHGARLRLQEASSAVDLIGSPLHQREYLILSCQLAFHEGRFAEAEKLSALLGDCLEGVSMRDRARLSIIRSQLGVTRNEDREAAITDMQRLAGEAEESSNVELAAEVWRALAEALAAIGSDSALG